VRRPIESVADAQRRAKKRIPKAVYMAIMSGNEKGHTVDLNVAAFDEVGFRERVVLEVPPTRDMKTTVLGQDLSFPVVLSPAAAQAVAGGGEVPAAKAAGTAGITIGHSNFASSPFEEVVAANPKSFFQLYWAGTRDEIAERVERMRRAGAKALIFTADATAYTKRDWGSPIIPERINFTAAIRYAPTALSHPRWLLGFLRNGGIPDLKVPNMLTPGGTAPTLWQVATTWVQTPIPTWRDVAWLRDLWGGPFMVKGVLDPDDARRAVDIGATAISVSNHGGNALDGVPASIRFLTPVVEAVGDQIEVLLDGGIRRGPDVAKALALGARAVLIGRPWFFGLAANGERGVLEVLEVFREGLDNALVHLGHKSIHDLSPDDLVIPKDFHIYPPSSRNDFDRARESPRLALRLDQSTEHPTTESSADPNR
jgi:heme/flavin dehydrogenase (mycofactocin system)